MEAVKRRDLLEAILVELGEKGYQAIEIEEAARAAGLSEAEFREEFGNEDECLFAAYEYLTKRLVRQATIGCDIGQPWPDRMRTGLANLLDELAAEPTMARVLTRAFPGIRPSTYERYVDLLANFLPFMQEGRDYSELGDELPGEVELLAVGSAEAIIFTEVDAGRTARLPRMMPEILFSLLVPFIGPDRAADEMRGATAI